MCTSSLFIFFLVNYFYSSTTESTVKRPTIVFRLVKKGNDVYINNYEF